VATTSTKAKVPIREYPLVPRPATDNCDDSLNIYWFVKNQDGVFPPCNKIFIIGYWAIDDCGNNFVGYVLPERAHRRHDRARDHLPAGYDSRLHSGRHSVRSGLVGEKVGPQWPFGMPPRPTTAMRSDD